MKVVIYARVSTDDKEQDPQRQIDKCVQYCELKGHEVLSVLREHYTGDSNPFNRDEGSKILSYKDVEGIVIYSMDRLTRQNPVQVIRMINNLKEQGIKVISITEPAFNMESEFSDIMLYIMTWFNNYYLIQLRRNTISGLERARRKGKTLGRPKSDFNKYRAYHLLYNDNWSQRKVALNMGVSVATINRFKKGCDEKGLVFIKDKSVSNTGV